MRRTASTLLTAVSVAITLGVAALTATTDSVAQDATMAAEGKKLAFNRKKGNCLACHMMDDGTLPGDIGPPLIAMKARYPSWEELRAQIYDARGSNPNTIMPPFGTHGIISDSEIDKITDYVWTL